MQDVTDSKTSVDRAATRYSSQLPTELLGGAPSSAPSSVRWTELSAGVDAEAMVWSPDAVSMDIAAAGMRALLPLNDLAVDWAAARRPPEPKAGDGKVADVPSSLPSRSTRSSRSSKDDDSNVNPPDGSATKKAAAEAVGGSAPAGLAGGRTGSGVTTGGGPASTPLEERLRSPHGDEVRVRVVVIVLQG